MSAREAVGGRDAVIAAWDAELDAIPDSGRWVAEQERIIIERGMVFSGKPIVRVARPNFVSTSDVAKDQQVVTAVTSCLSAAAERVLADQELAARTVGDFIAGSVRALLDLPHDYGHTVTFGRYDGARRADGLMVIEFNGGLPGGIYSSDHSGLVMREWPPFAPLAQRFGLGMPDLGAAIVASMRETWHGAGGSGDPVVLFAVPAELRAYTAPQVAYLTARCAEVGLTALAGDPGELTHGPGGLTLAGQRVDVVIRVFFTNMLAKLGDRLEALVSAVAAHDVAMVTPFRSGIMGHKSLFALITDPDFTLDVEPAQLALARAHLPWTRMLGSGTTTDPDGVSVALDRFAVAARDQLVLKPTDGTGGAGVTLGWECEPAHWEAALAQARAAGSWILQQRIELTVEDFPALAAGFPAERLIVDHNPLVINDRVAGYFARLSPPGGLSNMTGGGGSTAPTFVVSD